VLIGLYVLPSFEGDANLPREFGAKRCPERSDFSIQEKSGDGKDLGRLLGARLVKVNDPHSERRKLVCHLFCQGTRRWALPAVRCHIYIQVDWTGGVQVIHSSIVLCSPIAVCEGAYVGHPAPRVRRHGYYIPKRVGM
jgi:hypothetical protein